MENFAVNLKLARQISDSRNILDIILKELISAREEACEIKELVQELNDDLKRLDKKIFSNKKETK